MAKSLLLKFIDDQITKQLKPFLEVGVGPDGEDCSDLIITPDGVIKIVNMIVKTEPLNQMMVEKGAAVRFAMLQCKKVQVTIPWGNMTHGDWKLEVEGLTMLMTQQERESWSVAELERAKESSIEKALKSLTAKMKAALSTSKKGGGGLIDTIKQRILSGARLTVSIRNVHVRIERPKPSNSAPMSFGFVLPYCEITSGAAAEEDSTPTTKHKSGKKEKVDESVEGVAKTSINIGRAGMYCNTGLALSIVIPDEPLVSNIDYDVDGDGSISKAEERARQEAVFRQQKGMHERMLVLSEKMLTWPDKVRLLVVVLARTLALLTRLTLALILILA